MMPIEKQIVSLELSKRLKELGVKQESFWCWVKQICVEPEAFCLWNNDVKRSLLDFTVTYSAFTVAELGEMLPTTITHPKLNKEVGVLTILHPKSWWVGYGREGLSVFPQNVVSDSEANARAKMLIYLLENGLMGKERG